MGWGNGSLFKNSPGHMTKMAAMTIPYNGKFPRRQIFAVLSKKNMELIYRGF